MKRLLTAAAALSLLTGGVALAQVAPSSDTTAGAAPTSAPMTPAPEQSPAMPSGATSGPAMSAPAAPAMDSGTAETTDTPSAAPGSYPACTHKGQDRCMQAAEAGKGMHKKKMK